MPHRYAQNEIAKAATSPSGAAPNDLAFMRQALRLARRGYGAISPNPMVGAVLVKKGAVIGRGWHRRAGQPHAEIEAIHDAQKRGNKVKGATLYVTLEPCCTSGRTPPCTEAISACGIRRVVVAATDPNPKHAGRGFDLLRQAGIEILQGLLEDEATRLNEAFNHWIIHRTPFITVKSAMSLDGKIATVTGESKWITAERARVHAMHLRRGADAVLVGVNTLLADNPSLTVRIRSDTPGRTKTRPRRRIVLDSEGRTPLTSNLVIDPYSSFTTVVVTEKASRHRVEALAGRVSVWVAPMRGEKLDLAWLLRRLGREEVVDLLVEGGGEVNASFLEQRLAHRIAFFYAPKILGGRDARKAVAGEGVARRRDALRVADVEWRRFGADLFMTGRVG